jgi:hypothetical protein
MEANDLGDFLDTRNTYQDMDSGTDFNIYL